MNPTRGRPSKVDKSMIIETVLKHGGEIICNKKVVSKSNEVWGDMSKALNGAITASSLYTFVTCDRYNIRTELMKNHADDNTNDVSTSSDPDSIIQPDDVSNLYEVSFEEAELERQGFKISIPRTIFEGLIIERTYKRTGPRNQKGCRTNKVFSPGKWQDVITDLIWRTTRLKCAFNFKNHYLTADAKSGYINGMCNCGSKIRCVINDSNPNDSYVYLECTVSKGLGICGKRYLRQPQREDVCAKLMHKAVHVYRAEQADALMSPGDPEPPHLYTASVLSVAKHEHLAKQHLDRDPVKAVAIMKATEFKNIIHNIGLDPFYVHYWTNHQVQMYKAYSYSCIAIDATGSIIKKIEKAGKCKSKNIFLYHCVLNCGAGQFSISQMLSESHNTNTIQFWLMEWVRSGAPYPREVVTDSSRALLTAVIRTFTACMTLEEYANACHGPTLPKCFVRIDVAHFIKNYVDFLKNIPHRIKVFYLAAIGKLIVTRNLNDARRIIKAILLVSRSETDGLLECGSKSPCEVAKEQLTTLITGVRVETEKETASQKPKMTTVTLSYLFENITVKCDVSETDDGKNDIDDAQSNVGIQKPTESEINPDETYGELDKWSTWGNKINQEVEVTLEEEIGLRPNAHYCPGLANRLLKDLKLLPLWSNVVRDKFGYGRTPASSAMVEGEFNKIKSYLLKYETTPMRPDVFLRAHIDYINGRTKIVNAKATVDSSKVPRQEDRNIDLTPDEVIADFHDFEYDNDISVRSTSPPKAEPFDAHHQAEVQTSVTSACPACANNDKPNGAHLCAACEKPVHALEQCSIPSVGDQEGYGQRRICIDCYNARSVPLIRATREVEDWRGQGKSPKKKRRARYLGNNEHKVLEQLTFKKNRKLPIIKNGSVMSLKAMTINKKRVSLIRTCGFDSILQIILAVLCDWPLLSRKVVELKNDNALLAMAFDTLENGLRAYSYQLRAKILLEVLSHKMNVRPDGWVLLDAESNVGWLAGQLFKKTPIYIEKFICDEGCALTPTSLTILNMNRDLLFEDNRRKMGFDFKNIIPDTVTLSKRRKCDVAGCEGYRHGEIASIGDIVLFDVFGVVDDDKRISLNMIPNEFTTQTESVMHHLVGVVNYEGPGRVTRRSSEWTEESNQEVGHYTAIVKRIGGNWLQYDDTTENEKNLKETFAANPKLLVYICRDPVKQ